MSGCIPPPFSPKWFGERAAASPKNKREAQFSTVSLCYSRTMLIMNFTYRIYPDASQKQLMLSWLETCRKVYNHSLRELKDWLASRKCLVDRCSLSREYIIPADTPFPSYQRQQDQLPKAKKVNPELAALHSQVLQNTIRRLHDTWEAFQKRGFGFPRFKKYGQFRSFVYPQFKSNPVTNYHTGGTSSRRNLQRRALIKLPKIGSVVINLHRPIPEGFTVKQVRVVSRCRNTQWYVVITISSDVSVPDAPVYGRAIGIDLGLEKFLTTSDGTTVEPPKFLKTLQGKLKLLQRRAARKNKRSKNWEKAQIEVARLHHHIDNTRKNFHLQTAHNLCDQAQTIFAEDLNTVGLNRGMLRKECVDASFGAFLSLLEWVSWRRGVYFQRVNPRGTSQICPECGTTVAKPLSEREHICPECGYRTHRDHAASRVILARGLELISTAGLAGCDTKSLRQSG
jgi:putative transposase